MKRLVFSLASACICSTVLSADEARFTGKVVVELLDEIEFEHKLKLLEDFSFEDSSGKVWVAQKGGILDGASVSRELRSLSGLPFVVEYRKASVLHDYYSRVRTEPWKDVDRMLYSASLTEGVSDTEAKTLYMAVYAGGWRWEVRGSSCFRSCHIAAESLAWKPVVTQADLQPLVDWIQQADPSLDEIERHVDAVIKKPGPHLFAQGR